MVNQKLHLKEKDADQYPRIQEIAASNPLVWKQIIKTIN